MLENFTQIVSVFFQRYFNYEKVCPVEKVLSVQTEEIYESNWEHFLCNLYIAGLVNTGMVFTNAVISADTEERN